MTADQATLVLVIRAARLAALKIDMVSARALRQFANELQTLTIEDPRQNSLAFWAMRDGSYMLYRRRQLSIDVENDCD